MATTNKMFVHYSGTVDQFKALSNLSDYANKIVFIKGGTDGKGAAIYTHGEYYTTSHDVKALVDSLNIVKGVMVNNDSSTLKVASGHNGVINFSNGDNTVAVTMDGPSIKISVSEAFAKRVSDVETLAGNTATALGGKSDAANADGSAFARIAQLKSDIDDMTGGNGSIAEQIANAIEDLDVTESTGDYVKTIKQENGKIVATTGTFNFDEKGAAATAKSEVIGASTDASTANTIYGAKKHAEEKADAAKTYADGLVAEGSALEVRVKANETAIETLNGEGDGSVKKQVADAVASIVAGADEDFDTLKEVADWIGKDTTGAAQMQSDIATLKGADTVTGSVANSIKTAIEKLDVTDTAVTGKYVSAVSETDGKITVTRADLPTYTLATGTANGTVKFNDTDVSVKGLSSAAYTESSAYATAAQGGKADSALQSVSKGTDGTYVTTTVTTKSNNTQTIGVSVTTKTVANATSTDNGLATAHDAKSYADSLFAWEEL